MFFLGSLYLQRVLGYDALEIGLAFLPVTIVMGTLSLRYSERLIMRFGARTTLHPRHGADRRRAACCSPRPRSTAATSSDVLPADDPARLRRRRLLPRADDAGDVGRHASRTRGSPPAWSTPPRRSAARSAWPCWRRCRATRSDNLHRERARRQPSALTSGYHLAFLIGAGLVLAAIVVAVTVLQPEKQAEAQAATQAERAGRPPRLLRSGVALSLRAARRPGRS